MQRFMTSARFLLRNVLFAVLSSLAAQSAFASFAFTLTGPDYIHVGDTASFNLRVDYDPIAISPTDPAGPADYYFEHGGKVLYAGLSILDPIGTELVPWDPQLLLSSWSNLDRDVASSHDFTYSFAASSTGLYTLSLFGIASETVNRFASAACYANSSCLPDVWNDYTQYSSYPQSQMLVAVHAPEPETYAMLLAGLSLVGAMARRRKRG